MSGDRGDYTIKRSFSKSSWINLFFFFNMNGKGTCNISRKDWRKYCVTTDLILCGLTRYALPSEGSRIHLHRPGIKRVYVKLHLVSGISFFSNSFNTFYTLYSILNSILYSLPTLTESYIFITLCNIFSYSLTGEKLSLF